MTQKRLRRTANPYHSLWMTLPARTGKARLQREPNLTTTKSRKASSKTSLLTGHPQPKSATPPFAVLDCSSHPHQLQRT